MGILIQNHIYIYYSKGIEKKLSSNLKSSLFKEKINSHILCQLNEQNEIRELKFITKKRGRKSLDEDNPNSKKSNKKINAIKKVHDKFYNDNIRRKIKSLYHKYIINLLNNLIKQKLKRIKKKFVKMNIIITKDVSIEYNRNLLNKSIKDIIVDVSKKYSNKDINKNVIKFIEAQKNNEEIIKILNMTYEDLFTDYYLKSNKNDISNNSFEAHKEILLKKYGEKYLSLFIQNTENFKEFFINGKNRKSRKAEEVESINIPLLEEAKKVNNINEYYLNKNMVSSSTETDIFGINKKLLVFD
jgi:hypothetical protein